MWLPDTSALYASRRGGQKFIGWDADRYALVSIANAARAGNHLTLMVNRDPKKGRTPKAPEPFPTPDLEVKSKAPKPGSFAAVVASMMAAQRKKKELMNG